MVLIMSFAIAALLAQAPATTNEATLAGRVVDASTQAPLAGARVMLLPDAPRTGPVGGPPAATETDRDGRYAFASVAPGRYRVNAVKTGFTMPADSQRIAFVAIAAGEHRADIVVQMQRGAVIAGRVTDDAGEPVTDARVVGLRRPSGSRGDLLLPGGSTQVNDLGEFRLLVPPGEYLVQASTSPIGAGSVTSRATTVVATYFPSTRDQLAAQSIVVDSGQTYPDVVIRLIEAPAFHVSGVVRNEAGQPIANALLRLTAEGASARMPFLGGPNLQVRSDSAGRYSIDNITAGAYTLTAIAPVVIARAPLSGPRGGGITFGSVGGIIGGSVAGGVTTETRNGVTTEYRNDRATQVSLTIVDGSIDDFSMVVR